MRVSMYCMYRSTDRYLSQPRQPQQFSICNNSAGMAGFLNLFRRGTNKVVSKLTSIELVSRGLQERVDLGRLLLLLRHFERDPDAGAESELTSDAVTKLSVAQLREAVEASIGQQVAHLLATMAHSAASSLARGSSVDHDLAELAFVIRSGAGKRQSSFRLERATSTIAHALAGDGVVLRGQAEAGTVLGFYPGTVYPPMEIAKMPNYPQVDKDNDYLMCRYDGSIVDSKGWMAPLPPREPARPPVATTRTGLGSVVAHRNPLALAHIVNHPPAGQAPNVMWCAFDFLRSSTPQAHVPFIPNIYNRPLPRVLSTVGLDVLQQSIVLVATAPVRDGSELFLNYRYNPRVKAPAWYVPVDADEDARRWA